LFGPYPDTEPAADTTLMQSHFRLHRAMIHRLGDLHRYHSVDDPPRRTGVGFDYCSTTAESDSDPAASKIPPFT
jgi:hypothetical protein